MVGKMRKIALPNSCETLENWKSRIRVNLHFFVSVGSSLSLHCTVKKEEIALLIHYMTHCLAWSWFIVGVDFHI